MGVVTISDSVDWEELVCDHRASIRLSRSSPVVMRIHNTSTMYIRNV